MMDKLIPPSLALILAACSPAAHDGAVTLYDENYSAELVLDNADGITAPDGLLWRDGTLYIADEGGSAIRAWDGAHMTTLADARSGIVSPEDLRFDEEGTLWFTDDSAGGVWRVTASGAERVDGGAIGDSEGIARLASGGLAVGEGETGLIYRVTADGRSTAIADRSLQIAKPESMALAPGGALIVADNRENRITRILADGSISETALPADLSPETIALDGETLWITDSHNGRIYRMARGQMPTIVALFTGDLANVGGIALTPKGAVYISVQADLDTGRGYIVRLAPKHGGAS